MERRNSFMGFVAKSVAEGQEQFQYKFKRSHSCNSSGTLFEDQSLGDIRECVTSFVSEASSCVASLLSNAASSVKSKISNIPDDIGIQTTTIGTQTNNSHTQRKRTHTFSTSESSQSEKMKEWREKNAFRRRQTISDLKKVHLSQYLASRTNQTTINEERCKQWLTSLQNRCGNVTTMKKAQSVVLPRSGSGFQQFAILKKASSDDRNILLIERASEKQLFNTFVAVTDDDDAILSRSVSRNMKRTRRLSKDSTLRVNGQRPVTLEVNKRESLTQTGDEPKVENGVSSKTPSFVHTHEGWKSNGDGSVNIVPEDESSFKRTPHVRRKLKTTSVEWSKSEIDYAYNKLEAHIDELDVDGNESAVGSLNMSIQFLIISKRLKVSIHSLENLTNPSGNSKGKGVNFSYFVKVCLIPRNGSKQKRTKAAKGQGTIDFDKDIYLKHVTFENVHLLTLRFQLYRKTCNNFLNYYACVAETTVCLDDLDVIGKVKLCKTLYKKIN